MYKEDVLRAAKLLAYMKELETLWAEVNRHSVSNTTLSLCYLSSRSDYGDDSNHIPAYDFNLSAKSHGPEYVPIKNLPSEAIVQLIKRYISEELEETQATLKLLGVTFQT